MGKLVYDDRERVGLFVSQGEAPLARYGNFNALGMERDGELVAGVVIDHYNGANAYAHITVTKPGKDLHDLLRAFFDYAFNQLQLKRVTGMCPSAWERVLAFDKKIGFEEEFRIKDGHPEGDMVVLVMRPETCKWLQQKDKT